VQMCDVIFRVSGVGCPAYALLSYGVASRCQERETQELKPEFWILTSNLRLAVSPRPRACPPSASPSGEAGGSSSCALCLPGPSSRHSDFESLHGQRAGEGH
jgi:hypothetical protein